MNQNIDLNNAKIIKSLPADMIAEGVIIDMVYFDNPADKNPKFALDKGGQVDKNKKLVELIIETKYDERDFRTSAIFNFYKNEKGEIYIGERSGLNKFKKRYNSIPTIGMKVKLKTNLEGFFKLVVD